MRPKLIFLKYYDLEEIWELLRLREYIIYSVDMFKGDSIRKLFCSWPSPGRNEGLDLGCTEL